MRNQTTRTLDDSTLASNPGGISLSQTKLKALRPDLYGIGGIKETLKEFFQVGLPMRIYIKEQLQNGDTRAAVVVSIAPLIVAAYTDELDCVAMLEFPSFLKKTYDLEIGARLLTVNCYGQGGNYPRDFILGPKLIERWTSFHPMIAEFLSHDLDHIDARKREISEVEWDRAKRMGDEYLQARPGVTRDGRPIYSSVPRMP